MTNGSEVDVGKTTGFSFPLAKNEEIQNDLINIGKAGGRLKEWEDDVNDAVRKLVLQGLDGSKHRSTQNRVRSPQPLLSDRVLISGVVTPVALFSDEVLRRSKRSQRSFIVENKILGFAVEGRKIMIKAFMGDSYCAKPMRVLRERLEHRILPHHGSSVRTTVALLEVNVKSGIPATTSTERLKLLDDDANSFRLRPRSP
ncbi:hypothetical protein C1H46_010599 [Malus baccata]|uniref:Uncharacterized protein n=1 Tax=Malus baccata TaxID=106549 RepID=A0A540MYC7_MALBA|nr:hypothetical protein C1H46_010599 [Malus baccata]